MYIDEFPLSSIIKDIKIYKNKAEAISILRIARAFSALTLMDDKGNSSIYICYRNQRKIMGIPIIVQIEDVELIGHLKYYKVEYKDNEFQTGRRIEFESIETDDLLPILFLPKLCIHGYPRWDNIDLVLYAIIKSDWS